jgi:hypothetical protein
MEDDVPSVGCSVPFAFCEIGRTQDTTRLAVAAHGDTTMVARVYAVLAETGGSVESYHRLPTGGRKVLTFVLAVKTERVEALKEALKRTSVASPDAPTFDTICDWEILARDRLGLVGDVAKAVTSIPVSVQIDRSGAVGEAEELPLGCQAEEMVLEIDASFSSDRSWLSVVSEVVAVATPKIRTEVKLLIPSHCTQPRTRRTWPGKGESWKDRRRRCKAAGRS